MWEEDPRWQAANYRLLIGSTVVLTLLATGWSILERDWEFLRYWFSGLGAIVAALCIYATLVWLLSLIHIFHGFLFEPETSPTFLVQAVPMRCAA